MLRTVITVINISEMEQSCFWFSNVHLVLVVLCDTNSFYIFCLGHCYKSSLIIDYIKYYQKIVPTQGVVDKHCQFYSDIKITNCNEIIIYRTLCIGNNFRNENCFISECVTIICHRLVSSASFVLKKTLKEKRK